EPATSRVAIWILHRVASAEVRARDGHDTDASDVCAGTGLSRTTLWRLECRGQFPSSRKLTTDAGGWLEAGVEGWVAARASPRERLSGISSEANGPRALGIGSAR